MGEAEIVLIQEGKDITTHLTDTEQFQFDKYEQIIKDGLNTFLNVGHALAQIRDHRLYRATHQTFEKYCRERWDFGKSYANRQINGYQTINLLESKMAPIGAKNEPSKEEALAELTEKCLGCKHRRPLADRNNKGIRIPWAPGKCTHSDGLCESEPQPGESVQQEVVLPMNEAQTRPLTKLTPDAQVEAWKLVLEQLNEGKKLTAGLVTKAVKQVHGETVEKKAKKAGKAVKKTVMLSPAFQNQYQVMLNIISDERNSNYRTSSPKEMIRALKEAIKIIEMDM